MVSAKHNGVMVPVPLGQVGEFRAGFGFPVALQGRREGRYPFAKVGDISKVARAGGREIADAEHYVNDEDLPLLKAKPLPAHSIVFAKIGEAISQNFRALTTREMLIDNNTMGFVADRSRLDIRYALHFFLRLDLYRHTDATTVPAIRKSTLESIPIPLPFPDDPKRSLAEQKRIAATLDKADAIRRRRQEAARLADQLIPSLFFESYSRYFAPRPVGKLVSLEDGCEQITDGVHITPTYVEQGVAFLRITDIKNGTVDWSTVKRIPRAEYAEITRKSRPRKGDILYSKNGTIGIPIEITWDEEFAHFVSLARISPKLDVFDPTFLCTFLGTDLALRQATRHSKTLTVTNLHLVEIRQILAPCPPLDEQRRFVQRARRLQELCRSERHALADAEDLFNSLVQRAFRGEL